MPTKRKQTPPRGTEAAREFVQAATDRLRDEAANGKQPTEADLDYAYGVHGGSKVGHAPAAAAPPAPPQPRPPAPQPKPAPKPRPASHRLTNRWGWVMTFTVVGEDHVRVRRTYRGADVGEYLMPRCEARRYYSSLREGGFTRPEGDL